MLEIFVQFSFSLFFNVLWYAFGSRGIAINAVCMVVLLEL